MMTNTDWKAIGLASGLFHLNRFEALTVFGYHKMAKELNHESLSLLMMAV